MGIVDRILKRLQPQEPAPAEASQPAVHRHQEPPHGPPQHAGVRELPGLDTPLLSFGSGSRNFGKRENVWTLAHGFEGTQVFGETGAGKTSGSGAAIAAAFLRQGLGGLVLTAKPTDVYDWLDPERGFLRQAGIASDDPNKVIVIGEALTPNLSRPEHDEARPIDASKTFNFLDYEFQRSKNATLNLVQLFITALESGSQGNTGQEDAYWMDALRQLLTNTIQLVTLATDSITLEDVYAVIQTAPQSREQARSRKWQDGNSACWRMLVAADEKLAKAKDEATRTNDPEKLSESASNVRTFRHIVSYWLLDFAGLADRTRSVIVSTFTSKVTGLTRWPLFDLLCTGTVGDARTVDIVDATRKGKIVIVNLPVKRYSEVGRFAQILIKTVWQRGIERQPDVSRPVFLWADEAQFFATREDVLFQTTARSSGCATVYLTQNICNYYAMMPGKDPKSATDALLGNLATKIFHSNGDPTTNDWAERVFGKTVQYLGSKGSSVAGQSVNVNEAKQQSLLPVIPAMEFTQLKKGGVQNDGVVEALIFQGGRHWTGDDARFNCIRSSFPQFKA